MEKMSDFQIKRHVLKNPIKCNIKIQFREFLEFCRKIQVKIQDFAKKEIS